MTPAAHDVWAKRFLRAASPAKRSFRLLDQKEPRHAENIDITILEDKASGPDDTNAETPGWMVSVNYANAPDVSLFSKTYSDEQTARKVMDDLCAVAAEVEGLLRSEDFEKAKAATQKFIEKCAANGGQSPVAPEANQ